MAIESEELIEISKFISSRIILIRKINGDTQKELGDKIGVSRQQVSKYERNRSRISAARLLELAGYYKHPVWDFFPSDAATTMIEELT